MSIFQPEFFDIFGVVFFSFIVVVSLWALKTRKRFSKQILILLLIFGILGAIIDSTIVYLFYLK